MTGWLGAQLPRTMARDPVLASFVRGCEEIADSIRDQVADLEYELDIDLASPEMLCYLASWLGVDLQASTAADDPAGRDEQRRLLLAVGEVLGWRGTRRGVETLLEALTGSRAEVSDSGGVFAAGEAMPPPDDIVRVVLDHPGRLSERQILAFLTEELPVGTRVELRIRSSGGESDAG